jgi:CRISPR system Cascade subunit CasB
MSNYQIPDFLLMYQQYQSLKPGPKAELRRAATPDDLIEIPAFYRLLNGLSAHQGMQRLVYCLPLIRHQDGGMSLGQALAQAKISEKRLFMVLRSEAPNDLIQLRRLLKMVEPKLDWISTGKTLFYWNTQAKRKLLEDFFYHQNHQSVA